MSTNPTPRHTARPSRSRVALARVVGALDRASAYFDRHIVAFTATFSTLATVALALMVAFDDDRNAVAVVAIATPAFVAFLAFVATEDTTTRLRQREWRASARRLIAQHDAQREEWNAYCDGMATRYEEQNVRNLALLNDARDERDRMSASYEIAKVERDALESENANLCALIRSLISPTFADATRDDLRVWVMAGNTETAYAHAFHNGEGVSLADEITRRDAYAILNEATR
jgi:hypothetical protein